MDAPRPNFDSSPESEKIDRLRRAMYSRSLVDKIKTRDRRPLSPTRPLVGEDWRRNDEGVPIAMTAPPTIALARTILWWILGASAIFFFAAAAYFAYFFFLGPGSVPASSNNIDIAVAGPPQIASGQASEMQIVVTNRNPVPLQLADLVITYPAGTRSPTDYSTDLKSQRISLGTIASGAQRQGTVTAVFSGKDGTNAVVKVELEYRLVGSSAIYVASTNYGMMYSTSPLSVAVEGNTQTISGQPVEFTVHVSSNASAPIKDSLLSVEYPFGFTFKSATPAPDAGKNFWELGDMPAGGTRSIVIDGVLNGEPADDRIFNFTAGTRKSTDSARVDYPLSSYPFHLAISQPFLGIDIAVNKASGDHVVVAPGDSVNVSVSWQNNLSTAVTDAVIAAKLSGITIDGSSVRSSDGFYRSADSTMIWDKTTSSGKLATLAPGSHGTVGFTFQMPAASVIGALSNPHLDISVNAAGNRVSESGVPENLQSTATQRISLASSLQLIAQGLYYQNPFGGTGPMPPQAGSETTYAVLFTVNNTTSKITGATVTATLPPYVRFAGHWVPKTEDVQFDQTNNTMTWNLNTIDPGAGLNGTPPRQMAIQIGFTPSTSQIGEQPSLLQDITLIGTDSNAGQCVLTYKDKESLANLDRSKDSMKGCVVIQVPDVTTNLAQPSKSSKDVTIGSDKGFTPANATVVSPK